MIQIILKALQKIAEKPQPVYIGEGEFNNFSVQLKPGISPQILTDMEKCLSFPLPSDYIEFLKISNGVIFYDYGGTSLDSLENSWNFTQAMEYTDGIIQIGSFLGSSIVMNCKEIHTEKYLYAGDEGSCDDFIPLNENFTGFLDNLLKFHASVYWEWTNYGEIKKYNFGKY